MSVKTREWMSHVHLGKFPLSDWDKYFLMMSLKYQSTLAALTLIILFLEMVKFYFILFHLYIYFKFFEGNYYWTFENILFVKMKKFQNRLIIRQTCVEVAKVLCTIKYIYILLGNELCAEHKKLIWFQSYINQQQQDPNNLEPWVGLHSNKFGSCTLKVALFPIYVCMYVHHTLKLLLLFFKWREKL
jgi:hypothetical protein